MRNKKGELRFEVVLILVVACGVDLDVSGVCVECLYYSVSHQLSAVFVVEHENKTDEKCNDNNTQTNPSIC